MLNNSINMSLNSLSYEIERFGMIYNMIMHSLTKNIESFWIRMYANSGGNCVD